MDHEKASNMSQASFGSGDFYKVTANLKACLPEKLYHPQVCRVADAGSRAFSSERRHPVYIVDLPSKAVSVTIGEIDSGSKTGRHRHNYETILYVISGSGRTVIENVVVDWVAGDAVYIPVWAWHHHENRSDTTECVYVACENTPLLQNLGGIAVREEETDHKYG